MSVFAVVSANNSYGYSQDSIPGNGAKIVLVPDAPFSLRNDLSVTNAYRIGLNWIEGLTNGGSVVVYY
jgi:hypothetical protein